MSEPPSQRCLNCNAPAPERFCSSCGQATGERRAPFLSLAGDFLEHLSLDSKLPRSLFDLLFRPGRLTVLYQAGKRASHVPPLRMYLVISLVFFVVFAIRPPDVSEIDVYVGGELIGPAKQVSGEGGRVRRQMQILQAAEDTGWLGRWVEEKVLTGKRERFREMDPQELIDQVFFGMERHVKLALFVFLPLLAMALKVLFLGSGALYFDHLIFALHFQSFLFLGLVLIWIFHSPWLYLVAALLVIPLYLLSALRRVYKQRWLWLVPKFLTLSLAYVMLLGSVFGGVMLVVMRGI